MDKATTSSHPGILPSFIFPLVQRPIKSSIGLVSSSDLLSWKQQQKASERLVQEIVDAFVKSRRNTFEAIWSLAVNVVVQDNWRSALSVEERVKLLPMILRHRETFQGLTLRQIRDETHMPVVKLLRALAKLEALNWVDSPFVAKIEKEAEDTEPMVPAFVDEVLGCLRAPWVVQLQYDDLRFPNVGGKSFPEWLAGELKKPNVAQAARSSAISLLKAHQANWGDELQDVALHLAHRAKRDKGGSAEVWQRWMQIFRSRYGGPSGLELDRIGVSLGLTRERIRQICDALLQILAQHSVQLPALQRVLAAASRVTPLPLDEANIQLAKFLGPDAGLESAVRFCAVVKIPSTVKLDDSTVWTSSGVKPLKMVVSLAESVSWANAALALARRDCVNVGCSSYARVAGLLIFHQHTNCDYQSVKALFEHTHGFRILDEESGWFTLSDSEVSAAATRMKKLMSVCGGTTDLDTVAAAMMVDEKWLARTSCHALTVPPLYVLAALFSGWNWLVANKHNIYTTREQLDPEVVLSRVEYAAYRLIISKRGAATREALNRALTSELGITTAAVSGVLSSSPIISKLEHGVFGTRGQAVPAEAVLAIRNEKLAERSKGQAPDSGVLRITHTTSEKNRRVLYIPSFLAGKYIGEFIHLGGKFKTIRINAAHQIYHLAETADSLGIAPGEKFTLKLDLACMTYEIFKDVVEGE